MTEETEEKKSDIEQAAEDLFDYAIDREDMHWLLSHLPPEAEVDRVRVEYELPMLKIVTVGWCISYYLAESPRKEPLGAAYWQAVYSFSRNLSETTGLMIGQDIDYFQTLRERLDGYVAAMAGNGDALEPAQVIGPVFAANCGSADDLFIFMTGSKMFLSVNDRVRQYLEAVGFC